MSGVEATEGGPGESGELQSNFILWECVVVLPMELMGFRRRIHGE